ncbi:MAG TPA: BlaI/MecI/CopY family transcriptional regulator [Bryobacteraceae bacterium]|nr:BlaI/MecI/CopY family transcriptional regulator [Bryobacteraceae bacterium]
MAKDNPEANLTRRERQIMDILFNARRASGPEIQQRLPDAPSYSTVRTILRVLEKKGFVRHKEENLRYVYEPIVSHDAARKSALRRVLHTFFDGSAQQAVAALLDPKAFRLSKVELEEISNLIERAKHSS